MVIARIPSAEFILSGVEGLRVDSATKQSDAEFVISSETRNLDVSRAFDMTNEQKKRLLRFTRNDTE
ncbi:MAG: hypothetical protein HYW01_00585 [Deltaproteobacteria bacterium]|nr:hypothetical protein [Deltaproteobacteria bacterium]